MNQSVALAVKGATYRGIFASFIIFAIFGAVIVVIWYGASLVSIHEITVGDLTTYILYSMFVAGSMGSFPELYASIQRALGSSERVLEILNEPKEENENLLYIHTDVTNKENVQATVDETVKKCS